MPHGIKASDQSWSTVLYQISFHWTVPDAGV